MSSCVMTIDQPIVEWDTKQFKRKVQHSIVEAGRAAYRAGIPISNCPSFVDEDMTIDWRIGWRAERDLLSTMYCTYPYCMRLWGGCHTG